MAAALISISTVIAAPADVELWRLDCGTFPKANIEQMSDTFAYPGRTKDQTSSCYLIRHDRDYMLWGAGFTDDGADQLTKAGFKAIPGEPLKAQLSRIGVDPLQISIVGISHFHQRPRNSLALASSWVRLTLIFWRTPSLQISRLG